MQHLLHGLRISNTMLLKSFPHEHQLDKMDCGPTCLKIIAKYYGKFYSLQFLREKCGITREGVSLSDISYAAETIGLRTLPIKTTIGDLHLKVPLPCIIHWANSHFVVVYKVSKRKVFVSDPAKGLVTYSFNDFSSNWYKEEERKGILLAIEPQADFLQRQANERLERKKTFQNILAYFVPYRKNFVNLFIVMLIVTGLQAILPFISKAIIDVGIQTHDVDFITIMVRKYYDPLKHHLF